MGNGFCRFRARCGLPEVLGTETVSSHKWDEDPRYAVTVLAASTARLFFSSAEISDILFSLSG
jgi:hypothetical protein